MRYSFFIIVLLVFSACQSTKIKNETYKVSPETPELGSIGHSKSLFNLQNDFEGRTLPKLENEIRLAIGVVPFNRKLNKIYKSKAKYNQNQTKVAFIDSLPKKPELITIRLQDVMGFVNELNATYNTDVFKLLVNTKNSKVVSSLAVSVSIDDIAKIRQADAYYLTNSQQEKYIITLYKSGKKTETIDINPETIVAYQLSSFCWAISERGVWYIADMVEDSSSCRGNTKSKIQKKKKSEKLFDM